MFRCKHCGNGEDFRREGTCWERVDQQWSIVEGIDGDGDVLDTEFIDSLDTDHTGDLYDYEYDKVICNNCEKEIDEEVPKTKTEELKQKVMQNV